MNEYRCPCGWGATARTLEGMLAASEHHRREGCDTTNEGKTNASE